MKTDSSAPAPVEELRRRATEVGQTALASHCEEVDERGEWPESGLRSLAQAGLLGLHIPARLGGHGQGLAALAAVAEELGRHCSSTAMCYGMHCVASKVLAAKATPYHEQHFLRPIAEGRHITSLALSEPGTGSNFFLPRTQYRTEGDQIVLNGEKSFITSGGHADSYVVSAVPPGDELDPGSFSCFGVDAGTEGLEWKPGWQGFGMRGNSSRGAFFNQVRIPQDNLLGAEGDEIWYVFEVVAPYFIIAMSSVYLGIAQAAFDLSVAHLKGRRHDHTGETLSTRPELAHQVAEMWIKIERTRQLIRDAANKGDTGHPEVSLSLFAAKVEVAETVASVTQLAMTLSGGRGYGQSSELARLLRDGLASHIMAPTTQMLKGWLGRSLLDQPLL